MKYFSVILPLLASLAIAKPIPEAWLADAHPNDILNFTEIAEHFGIRDDHHLEKRSQRLWMVQSKTSFQTIPDPDGGATTIQASGFSIINPAGKPVFTNSNGCGGRSWCNAGGQRMALKEFPCMGGQFIWGCDTDFNGFPSKCAVWKDDASAGNLIDKRKGGTQYYNNFLETGYKGRCVVSFTVPGSCAQNAYHGPDYCRPLPARGVPNP